MYVSPQLPCNLVVTLVKYQTAPKHEAHLSHEAIGGAAAYEVWPQFSLPIDVLTVMLQAMKAYDEHCAKNGKPSSHAKAKEIAYYIYLILCDMYTYLRYRAGLLGAFIDREVETKGVCDFEIISNRC
jgi:hypothetical protein